MEKNSKLCIVPIHSLTNTIHKREPFQLTVVYILDYFSFHPYLVVVNDPLSKSLFQHFSVPLLKPFGLWDLLVRRVAVKNVVVSLTGRTSPDMTRHVPIKVEPNELVNLHGCCQNYLVI